MLIFFGVTYFSEYNQPKEIDWNQFNTEMLQDGEVAKLLMDKDVL